MKVISKATLFKALKAETRGKWAGAERAKYANFSDSRYFLPQPEQLAIMISKISCAGPSSGEVMDCDDHSFLFRGRVGRFGVAAGLTVPVATGIIWGKFRWAQGGREEHACNWAFVAGEGLKLIEPQDDRVFSRDQIVDNSLVLMLA